MGAIRGAICAKNTVNDISTQAIALIERILDRNFIKPCDVDAIIFSVTDDLNACYPASAVRERFNMSNTAFMCCAEMKVEGAIDHCIRACVFTSKVEQSNCAHCYLGEAKHLRADLPSE